MQFASAARAMTLPSPVMIKKICVLSNKIGQAFTHRARPGTGVLKGRERRADQRQRLHVALDNPQRGVMYMHDYVEPVNRHDDGAGLRRGLCLS